MATDELAGRRVLWQPQPGPQTLLLTCPVDEILFGGARGGGKTDGLIGFAISHAHRHGAGARALFLRRTYPELQDVESRCHELLPASGAVWAATSRTWSWPSGATLRLRYLDSDADAARYQGHQYTLILVDEAGNFPRPDPIDTITACLRSASGVPTQLVMSANPGGPGHAWLRQRYVTPAKPLRVQTLAGGRKRVYIPSKLSDNPALLRGDPTYLERVRAACVGRPWLLRAWEDGAWDGAIDGEIITRAALAACPRYALASMAGMIVQSWDTASKAKEINDYSVCTTGLVDESRHVWILDVWRGKVQFPDLVRQAQMLATRWQPAAVLVEDKSSGMQLLQQLPALRFRYPLVPILPVNDKLTRMATEMPQIASGRVHLPEFATWLLDWETELLSFPLSPHDDRVDSLSQLLMWARTGTDIAWRALTSA